MKRIVATVAVLAACLLFLLPAPPAAAGPVTLRVATYNIAAGAGADGRFDVGRTAAAIRELDADVVGLQEVDVHWSARSQWRDLASELAGRLGMRAFFGPIYSLDPPAAGQPRREFGIAVLSRHPVLFARNHEITRLSTQVPDPIPEPAPGFPQVALNVHGMLVHIYATHLDYRADPTVRQLQVADMLRIMGRWRGHHQILLGDFNARPDAAELAPLWSTLTDAWAVANPGVDGFTYPAALPDRRIDYVTATPGVSVRAVQVPPTLASDHLPVVAELTLPRH